MEQTHDHVLRTPIWVFAIRISQIIVSLIVLGLAGNIAGAIYFDEMGLAIATAVLTWVICVYALVTERVPTANTAYHIVAVLSLDAFMLVMWLATWAAAAAKRAAFKTVSVSDSWWFKRDTVVLLKKGLDEMAAIAGLGALVWLLFIATFVWTLLGFLKGRKDGRFPIAPTTTGSNSHQMEPKVEQPQPVQPQATGQYQQQPVQGAYPTAPQGTYSPPPQDQQASYGQYPPQSYPAQQYPQQQYPPSQPSEVSGHHEQHYAPPTTVSPPPQQPYPQQ